MQSCKNIVKISTPLQRKQISPQYWLENIQGPNIITILIIQAIWARYVTARSCVASQAVLMISSRHLGALVSKLVIVRGKKQPAVDRITACCLVHGEN